jgi:hypothetical protein
MVSSPVPVAIIIRIFEEKKVSNILTINKASPFTIQSQQESDGKIFNVW